MTSGHFPRQYARTRRFSLGVPRSFHVAPDGSRVTFLRSSAGNETLNRLCLFDVNSGESRVVADPTELWADADDLRLPPEEQARRERTRETGDGIVSYATNQAVTKAVFSLTGQLYSTDLESGETRRLTTAKDAFDPRSNPKGDLVAYVSGGNLYVTSPNSGNRLIVGSEDPDISYGTAEFIAAEEMLRTRGYWWGPDDTSLLIARVDVSAVNQWHLASPIQPDESPRSIRFPVAGSNNAEVKLELHNLQGNWFDVPWNEDGTWEYLVDVSWSARNNPTLLVQTRDQRRCAVVEVNPLNGSCTSLYEWSNDKWIEIVRGSPRRIGSSIITVEDDEGARRLMMDGTALTNEELQVREIIHGDIDGLFFLASTHPSETHLHHITLGGVATQMTQDAGVHTATSNRHLTVVTAASLETTGVKTTVWRDGLEMGSIEDLSERPDIQVFINLHSVGPHNSLNSAVLLPENADRDTPLPVLVDPYGGPHGQRVIKSTNAHRVSQWFANQGFFVVVTDGRGTPGKGPNYERAVWGDLAQPALDDQILALDQIKKEYSGMDLNRVGIRGWSYGGYLAALAVIRRPDRFKAAIAGAPVTDWRLYDTHYTERYLGHPDEHPDHYGKTDLTAEAALLSRPLLLIHGLSDDNVVAAHTFKLSKALLEAGRAHQVLPLSGVTHMTPQESVAENLLLLQLTFLKEMLKPL